MLDYSATLNVYFIIKRAFLKFVLYEGDISVVFSVVIVMDQVNLLSVSCDCVGISCLRTANTALIHAPK